jgi:SWI/SNF-related matrix-associated actin-dependent regulator 1 of chromatin subfamily A
MESQMKLLPLDWSAPQTVFTAQGERTLRTAPSTDDFRKLWNSDQKQALKDAGYSVRLNKARGVWEACHWAAPDAAVAQAVMQASRALDADINIPLSERARERGFDYFGFQKAGIQFMTSRPATLLADDMGVGKTIQIIGVANVNGAERILIVCPASALLGWAREMFVWLVKPLPITIVTSNSKTQIDATRFPGIREQVTISSEFPRLTLTPGHPETLRRQSGVVIINWDILHKFEKELRAFNWDVAAFDESQYAKNPKARRAQFAFGRKESKDGKTAAVAPIRAKVRICASGTPIKNRPIELFSQVNYLDPIAWPSWYKYATRYCAAHKGAFGFDTSGASNLDELQQRLRGSIMIRRMKVDVLTDLPEKTRQVVAVASNGHSNLLEKEIKAHAAWEAAKVGTSAKSAAFTELAAIRLEVGLAKVPSVLQHVEEVDQKTIIFCRHKEVQKQLAAALEKRGVVIYNGDMNPTQKKAAEDKFMHDASIQFFIGTIGACGVALTLTAASYEVFAELEWTPADLDQAEDRAYRQGQKNAVLVHHVVFDGSLDDHMLLTILPKQRIIKRALGDGVVEAPVETKSDFDPTKAMQALDRDRKAAEVSALPQEKVAALHEAVRMLATMCDGARQVDGSGFSKFDANFGRSLAAAPGLSPKQAAAAYKMVRKYVRQLPGELYTSIYGA